MRSQNSRFRAGLITLCSSVVPAMDGHPQPVWAISGRMHRPAGVEACGCDAQCHP
jgi:hypothetical protein